MMRTRIASLALMIAAGAVALTACGTSGSDEPSLAADTGSLGSALNLVKGTALQHKAPANTGDFFRGRGDSPIAQRWVQLSASQAGELDPVLVDAAQRTLYRFDKDRPGVSNCYDECEQMWPPVRVAPHGKIFLDGVDASAVGVIQRNDHTLQVTINGMPAYRFSGDHQPGDTNGQGVGGVWFGLAPNGERALAPGADGSPADTSAGTGASGETLVTLFDDAGFADEGSQQLSGSAGCQNVVRPDVASSLQLSGAPVKIWSGPDCTGESAVVSESVADLGAIGFDDTIESIRFDVTAPQDPGTPEDTETPAPGGDEVELGNGSAILDTGINFSEPDGSFAVSGPGCQNVPGPNQAKSLQLAGGPVKIWSGPDCTGRSAVVTESVADLGAIGFAGDIESIRFGD